LPSEQSSHVGLWHPIPHGSTDRIGEGKARSFVAVSGTLPRSEGAF
jgi:hypothetical protein